MSFSLILGPDSSYVNELCGGTLGFLRHWILTNICVTQANILTFASSTTARASGTFPYRFIFTSTTSANRLAPFIFDTKAFDQ
ncbi:hypothetical protein CR513_21638, partial [Mucuna pruriens]